MVRYILLVLLYTPTIIFAQTVNFSSTQVCYGQYTTLVATSTLGDTAVASYKWDLNNDGIFSDATGKTITYLFQLADTFLVSVKANYNAGGADSATKDVVVFPIPQVNFHVDNLCEGKAAIYTDESSITYGSISQYKWDFNNDGIVDDNSGPVVSYTVGAPATYITKLICVSDKGCSSFATKTTQVYNQPNASFSAVNTCLGTPVVFSNTTTINSENISFYVWSFGDGEQKVNNGNITYSYNSPLTYNVTLVAVSENFCKDTVTGSVTVFPSANLSVAVSDTIIIDGSSVTINALSTNAVSYLWSNNASSATINVNTAGTYSVTATTVDNCMATGSVKINAMKLPPPDVAANVLTPNGDGINDYFTISRLDLYGTCSVMIYNMWNDLVYSSTEYANDWDGTANGKIIDSGAYFYIISCTEQETFKGTLNILR